MILNAKTLKNVNVYDENPLNISYCLKECT